MFSLVFSFRFQWNIALNSFRMRTYYISEMAHNFPPTNPRPPPPPPKKSRPFQKPLLRAYSATRPSNVR